MMLVFWMFSFKPTFSLSSFTLIKRLFSSSSQLGHSYPKYNWHSVTEEKMGTRFYGRHLLVSTSFSPLYHRRIQLLKYSLIKTSILISIISSLNGNAPCWVLFHCSLVTFASPVIWFPPDSLRKIKSIPVKSNYDLGSCSLIHSINIYWALIMHRLLWVIIDNVHYH